MEGSRNGRKDVEGKVCIITGANTGIGYQAALQLSQLGAHVILACRSPERGNEAVASIKKELGSKKEGNIEFMALDLGSIKSIQNFAATFIKSNRPLDILVLNAGVMPMLPAKRGETVDGLEQCYGVNYVGHFLLTLLLLGPLKDGAPSRVISVSSTTHTLGNLKLSDLDLKEGYTHDRAYTQSKLANAIFAVEFNRRFSHLGIFSNSLCPGVVASDIIRDVPQWLKDVIKYVMQTVGKTTAEGASTLVYAATAEELEEVGGKYLEDCAISEAHPRVHDEFLAAELWDKTVKRLNSLGVDLSDAELYARVSKPSENHLSKQPHRSWFYYNLRIYGKVYFLVTKYVLCALFLIYLVYKVLTW